MKSRLTIFAVLIWGFTFGQLNWSIIDSGTTSNLNDIQFTSNFIGYIVGNNGTVLKTTDGGNSWSSIGINPTENISSVSFIDDSVGYIATQNRIYKTVNGGTNWTIETIDLTNNFNTVKFVSEQIGFIGTDTNIFKTIDGSQNWVNVQTTLSSINTISFPTSNTGYFTGGASSGYVYKTTDQGNSITTTVNPFNTIREEIQFLDNNIGFLIGWYSPLILKTTNGGDSWSAINANSVGGMSVHFLNEQVGYHTDNSGGFSKIYATNDGGMNWNNELTLNSSSLYGLKKFASHLASIICIGDNGLIYKKSITLSATNNVLNNDIKMFPNPTKNIINIINTTSGENFTNYQIYNLMGQVIDSGQVIDNKIDLKNIVSGAYLLQLGPIKKTFKIIKQ